jgi:hypothetical protein
MHNGPPEKNRRSVGLNDHERNAAANDDGASLAPAQTAREALFHSLAVQHIQRARVIELLTEISGKLSVLIDALLRNDASVHEREPGRPTQ